MNHRPPTSEHDGPQPERIAQAFAEMPLPPVPSDDETFDRVMAAATQEPVEKVSAAIDPSGARPHTLGVIMRVSTFLAAAAAIALMLFLSLHSGGGSVAFADVQERLARVQTAEYRMTVMADGQPAMNAGVQLKEGQGTRQVFDTEAGEVVTITSVTAQQMLTLVPGRPELGEELGQAIRINLGDAPAGQSLNPVDELRALNAMAAELEGPEEVDGRPALRYRFAQGGTDGVVWVDEATQLPLRARFAVADGAGGASTVEMTDFVWDVPLDDGLFDLRVPEGFRVVELDVTGAGEADLLRTLNLWAELGGGRFPDAVDDPTSASTLGLRLMSNQGAIEGLRDWAARSTGVDRLTDEQFMDYLTTGLAAEMSRGLVFLVGEAFPRGFEWHGKGVERGQADRVVCFWRDAAGYRVVYGDLRVTAAATRPDVPERVAPDAAPGFPGGEDAGPPPPPRSDRTQELLDALNEPPAVLPPMPLPPRTRADDVSDAE